MKFAYLATFCFGCHAASLVDAIHQVETGGRLGAIYGDSKKSLGPLQIHYSCWKDAVEFDKSIGGKYENCAELGYSKKIFNAYLRRYAKGGNNEKMARTWNGGPGGMKNKNTINYWKRVQKYL